MITTTESLRSQNLFSEGVLSTILGAHDARLTIFFSLLDTSGVSFLALESMLGSSPQT